MFYTIYKTVNKIDGKIYIGKHQTKDLNDDYLGSGKYLRHAIEKYGVENFEKEILYVFETEEEMNAKEAELVTEDFVKEDTNYNLCPGGQGGWGYYRNNFPNGMLGKKQTKKQKEIAKETMTILNEKNRTDDETRSKWLKSLAERKSDHFKGKKHSQESKEKMYGPRPQSSGSKNSQYGTMWNNVDNKRKRK